MKKILVTGASSGIGFSTVQTLLSGGYQVVGLSRRVPNGINHENFQHLSCDLTDFDQIREFCSCIPKVDGVVYSAGIVINNPIKYFNLESYNKVIAINQTAPLVLVSSLLRNKKLSNNSSIVFVSSINGPRVAIKGCAAYAASKSALLGIARVLALELSGQLIRVNTVLPGMVQTELVEGLSQLSAEAISIDQAKYPLEGRYAKSQEVSNLIKYLISDESTFITGQDFVIDGGYTIN
jgi:NAD(P)-dependent dehydrogenase (short-subunit alcohol dehydrogenase family)